MFNTLDYRNRDTRFWKVVTREISPDTYYYVSLDVNQIKFKTKKKQTNSFRRFYFTTIIIIMITVEKM